jgi:hypothetical protein
LFHLSTRTGGCMTLATFASIVVRLAAALPLQ